MPAIPRGAEDGGGPGEGTESGERSPEPASLDDHEWLALFPQEDDDDSQTLLDGPPLRDGAADLRDSKPHDVPSMLAACKETRRPGIAALLRSLDPICWWGPLAGYAAGMLLRVPAVAAALAFAASSGHFPPRSLWEGTLAIAFELSSLPAALIVAYLRLGRELLPTSRRRQLFLEYYMPSSWPANMVTWSALARDRPQSLLIAHRAGSANCTCLPCAGDVNRRDAASRFADVIGFAVLYCLFVPFFLWTPAVSFASSFWRSAWALTDALCVLSVVLILIASNGRAFHIPTVVALRYETRLRVRASVLLLDDLLDRLRRLAGRSAAQDHAHREPYLGLCLHRDRLLGSRTGPLLCLQRRRGLHRSLAARIPRAVRLLRRDGARPRGRAERGRGRGRGRLDPRAVRAGGGGARVRACRASDGGDGPRSCAGGVRGAGGEGAREDVRAGGGLRDAAGPRGHRDDGRRGDVWDPEGGGFGGDAGDIFVPEVD